MVKFKKFVEKKQKTKDGHIIVDEPIHFRMDQSPFALTKDGHVLIKDPIHFRMDQPPKNKLSEESLHNIANKNREAHGDEFDLSDKLHNATANNLSDKEVEHIHHYTKWDDEKDENGSKSLNRALLHGQKLHGRDQKMHDTIKKHAKASGHEVHLLSGTGRNFEKMAKESGKDIFHLPAHTSATHDRMTAVEFADNKKDHEGKRHFIHIHVKPQDKILHVSKHSFVRTEHETIIPSGTNLKYHGTTEHTTSLGDEHKVHHFTIHSQE